MNVAIKEEESRSNVEGTKNNIIGMVASLEGLDKNEQSRGSKTCSRSRTEMQKRKEYDSVRSTANAIKGKRVNKSLKEAKHLVQSLIRRV